jgi:hypothetical protein
MQLSSQEVSQEVNEEQLEDIPGGTLMRTGSQGLIKAPFPTLVRTRSLPARFIDTPPSSPSETPSPSSSSPSPRAVLPGRRV